MSPIHTFVAVAGVAALAILLLSSSGLAASGPTIKQVRDVGAFDGLALHGSTRVEVSQGSPAQVVVEARADDAKRVETRVVDGTLRVSTRHGTHRLGPVVVRVTLPRLANVSVAGSGDVVGTGRIASKGLAISVSGSGRVTLTAAADKADVSVTGSGHVTLDTSGGSADVSITGSGRVTLPGRVQRANVVIHGSGAVALGVDKRLHASVTGSGTIDYRGPKDLEVSRSVIGSGRISRSASD